MRSRAIPTQAQATVKRGEGRRSGAWWFPSLWPAYQVSPQLCERLGAMAEFVFHLLAQFGEGLVVAKGYEKRIVADATRRRDFYERQRATEAGGALFVRHTRQQTQKLLVVRSVRRILAGGLRRAVLAQVQSGEPRGMHARRPAQSVHLQTGIIGEHPFRETLARGVRFREP